MHNQNQSTLLIPGGKLFKCWLIRTVYLREETVRLGFPLPLFSCSQVGKSLMTHDHAFESELIRTISAHDLFLFRTCVITLFCIPKNKQLF